MGNTLCRRLLETDHSICALVFDESSPALEDLSLEQARADVTDPSTLDGPFASADIVVHLAAVISTVGDPDGYMQRVNVEGTRNVVQACQKHGVKRLIHMSSIHVFKQQPSDSPLDESRAYIGDNAPAYDRTKRAAEEEVFCGIESGLDAVILNPSGILGPNDFGPSIMGKKLIAYHGKPFPALSDAGFDWVDVRDVAEAIVSAMERGRSGERYLLSGRFYSMIEMAQIVQATSGAGEKIRIIPTWVIRLYVRALPLMGRLFGVEPQFTAEGLHALLQGNRYVSHAKAARELGFYPRPLDETIVDAYACFQRRGMLGLDRV